VVTNATFLKLRSIGKIARFAITFAVAIFLVACSALLGLTDPTLDNSIGEDGATDGPLADGAAGDGNSEAASSCPGINLASDPKNCGACAHDCLGGACTAGACQPVLIVNDTRIAPRYMVEDSTTLYFSNARSDTLISSVAKVDKSGIDGSAPAQVLGNFGDPDGGNSKIIYPYQVSLSASDLYVALTADEYTGNTYLGGIAKCSTSTCPADVADNLYIPKIDSYAVFSDGTLIAYGYSDLLDGGLGSQQNEARIYFPTGNTTTTLVNVGGASTVNFVIIDGSTVYIAASDGIYTTDETGNAGPKLATVDAEQMVVSNGVVYFISLPSAGAASIQSVPTAGGAAPKILASGTYLDTPTALAIDDNYLYIADEGDLNVQTDGHIYRCPISGCPSDGGTPTILSTGASDGNNARALVASDKDALYWGNRYGQIWKLAK
jgi:hypothetical protein